DGEEQDAHAGDQAADEAATRRVMATQHDVERIKHGHDQNGRGRGAQDQRRSHAGSLEPVCGSMATGPGGAAGSRAARPGRATPERSKATTPKAAIASTVISPRVSRARKSTRITLTTLCPWAASRLYWPNQSDKRVSSGCARMASRMADT